MTELVLDASIVLDWFGDETKAPDGSVRLLRQQFQSGALTVLAPSLLFLEILNVAGREWGWEPHGLLSLATDLDPLGLELEEPELVGVAEWVSRGLTAYDATYVALADRLRIPLVTSDALILKTAPGIAIQPAEAALWVRRRPQNAD
jgi:predicted nucleic acid-binding protein